MQTHGTGTRGRHGVWLIHVLWLAALTIRISTAGAAPAQGEPAAASSPYELALTAYYDARFEDATRGLEESVQSPAISAQQKIDALLYLAKARWAVSNRDGARAALQEIHRLDPAFVPDLRKILDIKDVYFDVFGASLAAKPGVHTIAVLDFQNTSIGKDRADLDGLETGMAHLLTSELTSIAEIRIVERLRIDRVLQEIELSRSDVVDPGTAARVGRLLGAQSMLMGGFMKTGDKIRIDARLVVTETGEIKPLSKPRVQGKMDDLFPLVEELARSAAKDIGGVLEGSSTEEPRPTLEALKANLAGIESVNRGEWDQAARFFEAALEEFPDYLEVQNYLAEIQPILVAQQ